MVRSSREKDALRLVQKIFGEFPSASGKSYAVELINKRDAIDPLAEVIADVITTLTPREQGVITRRYGIGGDGQILTQKEVALELGISRLTVSDTEARALRKLRHPSRSKLLRDLIDEFDRLKKSPPVQIEGFSDVVERVSALTLELINHLKTHSDDLSKIPPEVFEHLVAELLKGRGMKDVRLVGSNPRTSADIFAVGSIDELSIDMNFFVEVKRWRDQVGVEVIDRVHGAMIGEKTKFGWHAGMIVSVAGFKEIRKYRPEDIRMMGIELKDKMDLLKWIDDYTQSPSGLWLPSPLTTLPEAWGSHPPSPKSS